MATWAGVSGAVHPDCGSDRADQQHEQTRERIDLQFDPVELEHLMDGQRKALTHNESGATRQHATDTGNCGQQADQNATHTSRQDHSCSDRQRR